MESDIVKLAAILSTLAEPSTDGAPESILYLACGSDWNVWERMRHALTHNNLAVISGHYVTLTDKGREMAAKLDRIINTLTK